jgi:hypothetical protein
MSEAAISGGTNPMPRLEEEQRRAAFRAGGKEPRGNGSFGTQLNAMHGRSALNMVDREDHAAGQAKRQQERLQARLARRREKQQKGGEAERSLKDEVNPMLSESQQRARTKRTGNKDERGARVVVDGVNPMASQRKRSEDDERSIVRGVNPMQQCDSSTANSIDRIVVGGRNPMQTRTQKKQQKKFEGSDLDAMVIMHDNPAGLVAEAEAAAAEEASTLFGGRESEMDFASGLNPMGTQKQRNIDSAGSPAGIVAAAEAAAADEAADLGTHAHFFVFSKTRSCFVSLITLLTYTT